MVESNHWADRVRKKRPPPYFAFTAWISDFIDFLLLQCSGHVQFKNGVDYVEVNIFYKLEKTSGQTIWLKKIKTVEFFIPYHGHLVFKLFL